MKIILISIGTRGDMEPFLAIGEILNEKGHQVICAFPEQFKDLVEDSNMEFFSLGTRFIELLESDDGKAAMGGSGSQLKKILAYIKLAGKQTEVNKELVDKQYELIESEIPDRIVYNGKVVYAIIWELNNRGKTILVSPLPYMHYVKNHAHVAFNSNFGPFLNKLTYLLANFGLVTTVMIAKKWLKLSRKITRKQIRYVLLSNKAIYTISPSLFSRPDYWNENLKVLGYQKKKKVTNWQPDNDLNYFLEKHKNNRILLITFGSMTNPEPEEKTKIIVEILERNKIPTIINTASGGLVKLEKFDSDLIHFVSQIPYDWIFPKMYGVIHHGGSGTTHLALKHGCATMIIPHIIDQFVWNKIIHNIGVGPKGIKIGKISSKNLEPKILKLVNNNSFRKKAEQLASQMKKENFREEIYKSIIEN
jgi:sterol 3beta-glucosyltransferase